MVAVGEMMRNLASLSLVFKCPWSTNQTKISAQGGARPFQARQAIGKPTELLATMFFTFKQKSQEENTLVGWKLHTTSSATSGWKIFYCKMSKKRSYISVSDCKKSCIQLKPLFQYPMSMIRDLSWFDIKNNLGKASFEIILPIHLCFQKRVELPLPTFHHNPLDSTSLTTSWL